MTPEQITKTMNEVNRNGDTEGAHADEDALMVAILRAIALGAENAQALASAFLDSYDPDRTRWYA